MTISLLVYTLQVAKNRDRIKRSDICSFLPMGVFYALYNMKLSDQHENILKEMCYNYVYIILGLVDQYVGNWHNNAKTVPVWKCMFGWKIFTYFSMAM